MRKSQLSFISHLEVWVQERFPRIYPLFGIVHQQFLHEVSAVLVEALWHDLLDALPLPAREAGLVVGHGGDAWSQLYKNRSSRKIDSQRLFSREYDFPKIFSFIENQFSGKTYFYTIRPWPVDLVGRAQGAEDAEQLVDLAVAGEQGAFVQLQSIMNGKYRVGRPILFARF